MAFDWACHGKQPTIIRQAFIIDAQGFPSELWEQITPRAMWHTGPQHGYPEVLPPFGWPPPAASASYVLPDRLLEGYRTLGDVSAAIISALERTGYVERSFFRTERGVALVTRLERINDDGTPVAEGERWPTSRQDFASGMDLVRFLQGLFFVDPGHYRVIVFILRKLPFSQSDKTVTADEARAWLRIGANVLPQAIAQRSFSGGHCTVLIYEFASDGTTVHLVESHLTGKQHLEKSGLLSGLESVEQYSQVPAGAKEGAH